MTTKKEEQILKIIKFAPMIFIFIVSILITFFIYLENKKTFLEDKKEIEKQFIVDNKRVIQEEVSRVYDYISYLQTNTELQLKEKIKSRVYEAHAIATSIFNKYKDIRTKEEILENIKTALSDIRFNDGRGYFFMDDRNGVKIFHPVDTSIEGKNFTNFTDVKGYKLFETIIQTIKDKTERYDQYYWYKPNTNKKVAKKISFYKYFEPLDMAIGTGEYFDEFEKEIKAKALEYVNLVRFGKSGYIFILDYEGTYLSHINKDYVGKKVVEINNVKSSSDVIDNLLSIAKNGEGYYSYVQNKKPNTNLPTKKISYVKGLNNWGWIIGTGFYEDDIGLKIENKKELVDLKFNEYIENIVIVSSILTIILMLISFYISKLLENKFTEYKKDIHKKQTILYQQSKMAAMGEMIGNIAHQWRQPLSTITTASSGMVLQKELGILSDEFFIEASNKINASAQHLSKTIDDFRNFFSPNKVKSNFLLKNTFSTTLDLVSAQFNSRDIKIIKHIENIELYNYENELIQALINILNNARDELVKKPDNQERLIFIDVFKNKQDKAVIIIKDNAGGIPKEFIDRIFEPYFTTKHQSQGTGIGLYMTEEIVLKHLKGQIQVKNKDFIYGNSSYKGAQFKIILDLENKDN